MKRTARSLVRQLPLPHDRIGSKLTIVDKAREVFQTALEFFGDEEEQVEKAQVSAV